MTRSRQPLLWALVLSLALHLTVFLGINIELPEPEPEKPLTVRLQPMAPVATPRPPRPASKPARATPATLPAPPSPDTLPPEAEPPAVAPPDKATATATTTSPGAASEAAPPPPLTPLPRNMEIAYILYRGDQKLNVGRMTHTWRMDGTQYTLTSLAEATGLFSLFVRGTLIQVSRGEMTPQGLRPQEFWIQRGQSGNRTEIATFDWSSQTIRFGAAGDSRRQTLSSGALDVLSVLYQLSLTGPHSGVLRLAVTTGRKFERYTLRVVGEEMLETPLGVLRTEHLEKITEGDEDKLDIWLAADYRYLPARVRSVDRRGDISEQMVSAFRSD